MGATLVDSNVLFDFLNEDDEWFDWSSAMIEQAADAGALVINSVIYAEVSVRYERMNDLDEVLPSGFVTRVHLPWEAAFLAGKCFERYRKAGGVRRSPLPDFFIGAHAAVSDMTLLTRDPKRYRAYFPKLRLICP